MLPEEQTSKRSLFHVLKAVLTYALFAAGLWQAGRAAEAFNVAALRPAWPRKLSQEEEGRIDKDLGRSIP